MSTRAFFGCDQVNVSCLADNNWPFSKYVYQKLSGTEYIYFQQLIV